MENFHKMLMEKYMIILDRNKKILKDKLLIKE